MKGNREDSNSIYVTLEPDKTLGLFFVCLILFTGTIFNKSPFSRIKNDNSHIQRFRGVAHFKYFFSKIKYEELKETSFSPEQV